jgi:histidinol-phosphatase (PHP family)
VHFIDDWAFDDPERTAGYDSWELGALWERYFDDLIAAARSGLADVMAHADLVKKFCKRPDGPVDALYAATAAALREAGVAVEVNTAGLRKPCRELYPAPALLEALRREGVPATIGSDAHVPTDVGAGAHEAVAALRDAGYRSVVVFRNRTAEEVGIDDL